MAALVATVAGFFGFLRLVSDVYVLVRAPRYQRAVLEVEWTRLFDYPEAVGTIAGKRERLPLAGLLPRPPRDLNDLQDMTSGMRRIDVLYDPQATRTRFEGATVRVLRFTPDLRGQQLQRVERGLALGNGAALALLLAALVLGRAAGQPAGCWAAPAVAMLGFQVLCVAFMVAIEVFAP